MVDQPPPKPSRPRASSRRRIGAAVLILALSAVVFCMAVVRQRDVRLKQLSLSQIREVESWVREYYKDHGFLPASLASDRTFFNGQPPRLDYPKPRQILLLRDHEGPILLVCAPMMGMITPGGDGFAVLIFENEQFRSEWLSPQEYSKLRAERRELFAGS